MRVHAFDLSLVATGAAGPALHAVRSLRPRFGPREPCERLAWLRDAILAETMAADLVVLEGYSYGSHNQSHQLGELGGVIRLALHEARRPFVTVAPTTRMAYATGKGQATKEACLAEAVRRFGYDGASTDEADAMTLLAMALDAYGRPEAIPMPQTHRAALAAVAWPRLASWQPVVEYSPKPKKKRKRKGEVE